MSGYLGYQENYLADAPMDGYNYASVSTALVAPLLRGTVDIASADMADPPVINPNWLPHPTDQALMLAGFKRVRQMFNSSAMQPALLGSEAFPGPDVQTDAEILHLIRRSLNTVFHASATCAMGRSSDPAAVVDSHARVIGVQNLRVVDASAFPILPPGHPMATVCKSSLRWCVSPATMPSLPSIHTTCTRRVRRCMAHTLSAAPQVPAVSGVLILSIDALAEKIAADVIAVA